MLREWTVYATKDPLLKAERGKDTGMLGKGPTCATKEPLPNLKRDKAITILKKFNKPAKKQVYMQHTQFLGSLDEAVRFLYQLK